MVFFDTETCGLHGPIVLIQYQFEGGGVCLHDVWLEPIDATLRLIESFCNDVVIGFNLAFDWFHICQTYTTLSLLKDAVGGGERPLDYISLCAYLEKDARDGVCLKPKSAHDVMLHARRGEYQSLMDRSEVRLKRVPIQLAHKLAEELGYRIPLKDVYFSRRKDPSVRWQVMDIENDAGEIDPSFKDVVLKFSPSSALKALAIDALGLDETDVFEDVAGGIAPVESGFAPYALAPIVEKKNGHRVVKQPRDGCWFGKWPAVIEGHVIHWKASVRAREYARKDVVYTKALYEFFGSPDPGDTNSILACMVGATRWRGFSINLKGIRSLMARVTREIKGVRAYYGSTESCYRKLCAVMSQEERLALVENGKTTTRGIVLEAVSKWRKSEVCDDCFGAGCQKCNNGLVETDEPHPAAVVAREILDYRHNLKELELYEKLIAADRLHPSFVVTGTLSDRMSGGGGGINAQGIKSATYVRECFTLVSEGEMASGGDFKSHEVNIADAVYKDEKLHDLLVQGVKIHGLFGTKLFKPMTYEEILATDGLPGEEDKYKRSKNGVFAVLYGGDDHTLESRAGVPREAAREAYSEWIAEFKGWGAARERVFNMFCSMRQPKGIGSKVEWHEPAEYIESLFGFRRYYTLENKITRALFEMSSDLPQGWKDLDIKVVRRPGRIQTAVGAVQSALIGAAFSMQSANMRSAANHEIQSTGGQLTKFCQAELWELQPCGVHEWQIRLMNVHDEILAVHDPTLADRCEAVVNNFILKYRAVVPLLGMSWKKGIHSWAEKK